MMELATNTFTKGLLTDIHPMMLTNEVLSDCLNGTVITMNGNEPALQNDMGNVRIEDANLPSGYTPVGMKEYGGVIYVAAFNPVTGKSLIGSFPSPERKKSLDDDLKATFDFDKFQADSYYEDLNLNGTYDNNESYFLKNDSYLVPLTGSVALHVGDKFVIYSSSELSAISDEITNWNNVYEEYLEVTKNNETILILTKGIAYSPKNRKYTIQVGILNEQNEFVDITKSLVRWDGNDRISDFINDSDIYKFNKGYHIAIANSWEHIDISDNDRQFILNRQANPINNFSYKLAGPLYLKVSYNHVLSFNYDIEGLVNGSNLELTIKGYFTYNCPDVTNAPTLKTVIYLYIYKGYELELQFLDNDENPAHWSANQSEIYTGPTGYEWENTKPNKDFIYISIRKKIDGIWGLFSEPVLFDDFVLSTSSEDYYTYELAEATDIDDKLINYDFNITKFINAGTEQQNIPTDPNPSSIYSDIAYDKLSNLYSCTLTKKYVYNLSELSNIIDSKLDYEIKTYSGLTKENNYTIYLKNLCYNGIIDVSLLNSGELTLKQYKFYNKLATKDDEKNLSLLLLRFENYPKEGESRRNLKIEFRNINTSEDLTPKRLITDLKITNGVIQLPFTWEQVKKYNSSTEEWDINSLLDSRKVYDIKIYYDLYDKDDNLIESNVLYDDIATKAYIDDTDFDNLTPAELVTYKPCFKYDTDSISYEMTVTDYTSNPPLLKTITLVGDTWEDENLNTHIVTEILYWRTERWFLTTELFNDLYSDLSGIDDYCNKSQTDDNLLFLDKLIYKNNFTGIVTPKYGDIHITKLVNNQEFPDIYCFTELDKLEYCKLKYSLDLNFDHASTIVINQALYPLDLLINKVSEGEFDKKVEETIDILNFRQLSIIYYPIRKLQEYMSTNPAYIWGDCYSLDFAGGNDFSEITIKYSNNSSNFPTNIPKNSGTGNVTDYTSGNLWFNNAEQIYYDHKGDEESCEKNLYTYEQLGILKNELKNYKNFIINALFTIRAGSDDVEGFYWYTGNCFGIRKDINNDDIIFIKGYTIPENWYINWNEDKLYNPLIYVGQDNIDIKSYKKEISITYQIIGDLSYGNLIFNSTENTYKLPYTYKNTNIIEKHISLKNLTSLSHVKLDNGEVVNLSEILQNENFTIYNYSKFIFTGVIQNGSPNDYISYCADSSDFAEVAKILGKSSILL